MKRPVNIEAIANSIMRLRELPDSDRRESLIDIAGEVLRDYESRGWINSTEHTQLQKMLRPSQLPIVQLSGDSRHSTRPQYECDCCGACCQGHLLVEVFDIDVIREPHLASADRHRPTGRTYDELMQYFEEGKCLVIAGGSECKFLTETFKCAIHPTRPNVCVGMEAGDEQCQYAREQAGHAPLEPI